MELKHTIFSYIPNTWEVKFADYDTAHKYFEQITPHFDRTIGTLVVNNDSWYIDTKMTDDDFEKNLVKNLADHAIDHDQYTLTKTEIGKFWIPGV